MNTTERYSSQLFGGGGGDSSSTWMAAVVIAIARKHTFRFKEQNILIRRVVFANRLPRIGILNRRAVQLVCEENELIFLFFFFLYI